MKIKLIALGTHMPNWTEQGYTEYAKRITGRCSLELVEIPLQKRTKTSDLSRVMREESKQILSHIASDDNVIALAIHGQNYSTEELAIRLQSWLESGQTPVLLIGGPEGLSADCLKRANSQWSLSPLTLPHPLVRVIVAEQIYRALSILQGHPYHR